MKIGILGGTFNPPHLAHLRCAEEALAACALDLVLFVPAHDPPHKPLAGAVSFEQRCHMVRLAIAGHPAFQLSLVEGERSGKSYSVDTLSRLSQLYPDDQLHFIIGSDSFLELGLWHRYAELVRLCHLIVMERPGREITDPLAALPVAIRGEFRYSSETRHLLHTCGTGIRFVTGTPLPISSTDIRALAAAGQPLSQLVPPSVEDYLRTQRIYT